MRLHRGVRRLRFAWGVSLQNKRGWPRSRSSFIRRFNCYDSPQSNISKKLFFDHSEGIVVDVLILPRIYNALELDFVVARTEHVARNHPRDNLLYTLWFRFQL